MRVGTVIAELTKGTWETLATPDMSIIDQKQLFKGLRADESGKYTRAVMLTSGPGSKRVSLPSLAKIEAKKKAVELAAAEAKKAEAAKKKEAAEAKKAEKESKKA